MPSTSINNRVLPVYSSSLTAEVLLERVADPRCFSGVIKSSVTGAYDTGTSTIHPPAARPNFSIWLERVAVPYRNIAAVAFIAQEVVQHARCLDKCGNLLFCGLDRAKEKPPPLTQNSYAKK